MECPPFARGESKDFCPPLPEWKIEEGLIDYPNALATMESRALAIFQDQAPELIWLCEHPSLYTLGTSGKDEDVLENAPFPAFHSGRGGQVTYHGPGQRIAYVMLDLKNRGADLRSYVRNLEGWIIQALLHLGVTGFRAEGRVGIWVDINGQEKKIAAIGVRVKKWVTLHGISLNVNPDLSHYNHIIPCGLPQYGLTSLEDLGITASFKEVDHALQIAFTEVFHAH
ncbi:Lipoyl(octanoyl) transferase LipB [Candidatus Bealeia paramacronuclearis]|uniref:Octanoyltransferase n=1 Tax=Candidatus Bealeia paramacronuclearis TaxID=1921001 RepID=A0ABZ2C9G6_9PROT|nr:Lipoyl(octanoyl) transferase LipB [Candidatus Bealeia paramacronuclearis]